MKGQRPQFVIMDEIQYVAVPFLIERIRPTYREPNCCEPCSAAWQVLTDLADEIEAL